VAVQWLNQAFPLRRDKSCFYQSSCLVDSEVLRNRHLPVAAKRYMSFNNMMRYIIFIIVIFPFQAKGQLLKLDGKLIVYDTTAVIKSAELKDKSIKIISSDYTISFDINLALTSIDKQTEELEGIENLKEWQLEAINQIKRVRNYLAKNQAHVWMDFWNEGEFTPIDEIKNDELLTKKLFWELACPMLDEGQFELIVNSEPQNQILKTTSSINGAIATVYVTERGIGFWMCPPIIID
jgi:hypothetical protein